MVGESLERRRAVAQRMQVARDQQMALESLRKQVLPDGRLLGDVDRDGFLFDILQAMQPVVRRHSSFKLDLTTHDGIRLRVYSNTGNLTVAVMNERRQEPKEADVIDLRPLDEPRRAPQPPAARDQEVQPSQGSTPPHRPVSLPDDGSALSAALRRQQG